jgi:hypothetical protein
LSLTGINKGYPLEKQSVCTEEKNTCVEKEPVQTEKKQWQQYG